MYITHTTKQNTVHAVIFVKSIHESLFLLIIKSNASYFVKHCKRMSSTAKSMKFYPLKITTYAVRDSAEL